MRLEFRGPRKVTVRNATVHEEYCEKEKSLERKKSFL